MEILQTKIWSAQDSQEQLEKKADKCHRLSKKQPELLEQIKKAMEDQKAAQEEADKHEAKYKQLSGLHQANAVEIERLNVASNAVLQTGLGQKDADVAQVVARSLEGKLRVFDEPILAADPSVAQEKNDIVAAQVAIMAQWATINAACDFLQEFVATKNQIASKQRTRRLRMRQKQQRMRRRQLKEWMMQQRQ